MRDLASFTSFRNPSECFMILSPLLLTRCCLNAESGPGSIVGPKFSSRRNLGVLCGFLGELNYQLVLPLVLPLRRRGRRGCAEKTQTIQDTGSMPCLVDGWQTIIMPGLS